MGWDGMIESRNLRLGIDCVFSFCAPPDFSIRQVPTRYSAITSSSLFTTCVLYYAGTMSSVDEIFKVFVSSQLCPC